MGESSGGQPACSAGLDSGEEREDTVPGLEENRIQRRLPGGNRLALKRTVPQAFVCVARDLFSIYFLLFVVYRRLKNGVAGCMGAPIGVQGEPPFPAARAGLCRQGWGTQPRGAARFVCEGKQNFNEPCFHSSGLET